MAAGVRLVPYEDLEESSMVFGEGKTNRRELEFLVFLDRLSQGKKPFLWKSHDLKEKNTLTVTSLEHAGELSTGSRSLLGRLKQDH